MAINYRTSAADYREITRIIGNQIDPEGFLHAFITFISNNLKPENVFEDSDLASWAEENGYKKES